MVYIVRAKRLFKILMMWWRKGSQLQFKRNKNYFIETWNKKPNQIGQNYRLSSIYFT